MSGWIKMGVHLRTHPKVVRMASALKADRLRVIGGLWAIWCIFDAHTDDGLLEGYTLDAIDVDLGWRGFGAAMQSIGWLEESESGLHAPDYEVHNGATAKRRVMDTSRKAASRESSGDVRTKSERIADIPQTESGQMSASDTDKKRARGDKRREEKEKEPPKAPRGAVVEPEGFLAFWKAWPQSTRRGGRDKCLDVWRLKCLETQAAEIVAHVVAMAATKDWTKEDRQFVPAPVVYLRSTAWTGADLTAPAMAYEGAI